MRFKLVFVFLIFTFLNCNSEPDMQSLESSPPLTDVLTLELSFGADNLPDDYLMAKPFMVNVDNNENILVSDEYKIKIYDSNGNPVTMIGGRGEGPGDFGFDPHPTFYISPKGYLTEMHSTGSVGIFNIFRPDYSLLESTNFMNIPKYNDYKNEFGLGKLAFTSIIALDRSRLIYSVMCTKDKNTNYFINYVNSNKDVTTVSHIEEPWGYGVAPDLGYYSWALLSDEMIAMSCSSTDVVFNENGAEYSVKLISHETGRTTVITHPFTPEEYPQNIREKTIKKYKDLVEQFPNPLFQENYDAVKKVFSNITFKTPINRLRTDGGYIFVFTNRKNEAGKIFTDIFDAGKKQYIASAYFPFMPMAIKNGYAYRIKNFMSETEYSIVEKYKIDPAVYGK